MIASVRETQKRYCSRAMAAAILIGLALILGGQQPLGKGLILGTLFSVLNFVLMGETLTVRLAPSRKRASLRSLAVLSIRYFLMAIPLVLALKLEQFNLPSVLAGMFMVQILILGEHLATLVLPGRPGQL